MKAHKVFALAMSVAMSATAMLSAVSANAEEIGKGNITTGFDYVYNQEKSSETTRVVDVYINGITSVKDFTLKFNTDNQDKITNEKTGLSSTSLSWVDFSAGGLATQKATFTKNATKGTTTLTYTMADSDLTLEYFEGGYLGSMVFGVTDKDASFTITTTAANTTICSFATGADTWPTLEFDTLTVPAFATTPVVPEPPVDTRADFEAADARKIGRYDADKTAVPVDAWLAEIDYSAVKLAEGASLAWKVNVSDETIAVANGTTVSGEASVFYGLAIAGRADQLDTITTVQLIAE